MSIGFFVVFLRRRASFVLTDSCHLFILRLPFLGDSFSKNDFENNRVEEGMERSGELEKESIQNARQTAEHRKTERDIVRLTSILDSTSDLVGIASPDGLVIYLNAAGRSVAGVGAEEDLSAFDISRMHPAWAWKILRDEGFPGAIRQGVWEGETAIVSRDGVERPVSQVIIAHRSPDGTPEYFSTIIRDISDRKRVEAALRESEKRYRNVLENLDDAYYEVDLEGNYVFFNEAMVRKTGYSWEELSGTNYRQLITPETDRQVRDAFLNVYRTGKPVHLLEHGVSRKDGSKRNLESWVSPVLDEQDRIIGFRGVARDVTERKQAEEEKQKLAERLHRVEQMESLGQLAGGVAHVLNNILGILGGYAELLLAEIPEDGKARQYVNKMIQSTQRGTMIIQDLLTLARRGVAMAGDVVNLNPVISGFLTTPAFQKMKADYSRVCFRTECDPRLPDIKGSQAALEKMLMNLVSNAAEAITGEGEVTIRTENRRLEDTIIGHDEVRAGDYVVLKVSDTGTGIADENKKKIFEPFYTRKAMGKNGTGLGLSIVWGTVKDHNGYIDVLSRVGEGSTFTVYFPVLGKS
jgi:PAS domain S-box-containing protein